MNLNKILIQAIGLVGAAIFALSVQCKKNKNIFRVQCAAYLMYAIHFALLGATTGGISYVLDVIRSACLSSNNKFLKSKTMCAIICIIQIITGYFTWVGWITLLPVVANVVATIGGYSNNGLKIRLVAMFVNSPLWIVYDIIVGSWAGVIDELLTEASIIVSIIRYGWKNLGEVNS